MDEVGPNLFHASGTRPDGIRADLVAILRVRDEMWRLPFVLAYHRWLGVQHFIVIDNRSHDGTPDLLARERDVTCISAPGDFGAPGAKWGWIEWALRLAPPERWNLQLDADELFVGANLRPGELLNVTRALDAEGAAIAVATMVDCYPANFPFVTTRFDPVPWQRAPYFDAGPYFRWAPAKTKIDHVYFGVRERLLWPHWRWIRRLKKVVPRPLRTRHFQESPPLITKMPLVRNVPGLKFTNAHISAGAPRSRNLFGLLHYKFDIDLAAKVGVALRERQYWKGSRDYQAYARIFSKPASAMCFEGTREFTGVDSLTDTGLMFLDEPLRQTRTSDTPLPDAAARIWRHGDYALQQQVWESAWGASAAA